MGLQKNVAGQTWLVFAFEDGGGTTPGAPVTGDAANITAQLAIDGGALSALGDTNPAEIDSTNAPGYYRFDLTQAETNGYILELFAVSATANVQVVAVPGVTYTVAPNFSSLSITAGGLVDITQAAADKVWGTTTRTLTALGTGLVDEIWDRATSAITAAGSIGKLIVDNVDAAISSRFADADKPTNFGSLSITAGGLVDITQAAADKVWASSTRTLTAFSTALALSVWDVLESAIATANSIGAKLKNNLDAAISAVETDTQDIQSRLPASLSGGRMDSDVQAINALTGVANVLSEWLASFTTGAVTGTPSAAVFATDLSEATDNHYNTLVIAFRDGVLQGQARRIKSYNGTTKEVTPIPAFTEAPSAGDTFVIVPVFVVETDANGRVDVGSWLGTAVTLGNGAPDVNVASKDNIDLSPTEKASVNAEVVDVIRTDTIPDSYAADGAQPTIAQAILAIHQFLQERAVSGTTVTVKKPDGSTTAMTFTLDDGDNPTSITRAT